MTSFRVGLILSILFCIGAYTFEQLPNLIKIIELKTLDWRFQMRGTKNPGKDVIIVGIDEKSIKKIGRWPWPRKTQGLLVDKLNEMGAKTIGFDLILSEPENSEELTSLQILKTNFHKMISDSGVEKVDAFKPYAEGIDYLIAEAQNDQIFAKAMKKHGNTIISLTFDNESVDEEKEIENKSKINEVSTETAKNNVNESEQNNHNEEIPFDLFDQEDEEQEVANNSTQQNNEEIPFDLFDKEDEEVSSKSEQNNNNKEIPFDLFDKEDQEEVASENNNNNLPPLDLFDSDEEQSNAKEEELDFSLTEKISNTKITNIENHNSSPFKFYNKFNTVLKSIEVLEDHAKDIGHVNFFPDIDGNLRWADLIIDYNGNYYPSFNLQILKHHLGLKNEDIKIKQGEGLVLGKTIVPLDKKGRLLMSFYGPQNSFQYISFCDVILPKKPLDKNIFKDKIVLIGAAATGLGDVWATPFDKQMPGVEKHATIMGNILNNNMIAKPANMDLWNTIIVFSLGLLLAILIPRVPSLGAGLISIVMLGIVIAGTVFAFQYYQLWINMTIPCLAIVAITMAIILFRFFTEEREKKKIKGAFEHYLSPDLVDDLVSNPDKLKLGGEMRDLTILFSDIRNFTSISEGLHPHELVNIINTYLSEMTDIVLNTKGYVDKFIGDAIMAIYGAPVFDDKNAESACISAWQMIENLKAKKSEWQKMGFPEINIGIGLNSGPMLSGNMGSEARFDYTVMGDAVNLGSRLEGLTKEYGANIIISESTRNLTNINFTSREIDFVKVKGKEEPIRIYELIGIPGDNSRVPKHELEQYWEARRNYLSAQFDNALKIYTDLNKQSEHKLYKLYIDRCEHFMKQPVGSEWNGVFTFTHK